MTDVTAWTGYKDDRQQYDGFTIVQRQQKHRQVHKMNDIKTWIDLHNYRRKHMDMFTKWQT